jgi:integrase
MRRAQMMTETKDASLQSQAGLHRKESDFVTAWTSLEQSLLAENLPVKTIGRYRNTFRRLFVDFRNTKFPHAKSPSQLSLGYFEEYRSYYGNQLGRSSGLRAELIIVKAIMQRLYRLEFCTKELIEALKAIKKPKAVKKEYPDISKTKIGELFTYIKKDRPDFYHPLYFIFRTGRRIEETLLIKKADIVWNKLIPLRVNIRAEITKTGESAPLKRLDSDLQRFLQQVNRDSQRHQAPYLFLNRQQKKCNQRRVCLYLKEASKRVIGIIITPHYFRHRFMTECALHQVPIADAMAISGHKDPEIVLSYYSHSTDAGQDKVLEVTRI